MRVFLNTDNNLAIRRDWDETQDLVHLCGLGGNGQFNFSTTTLVDKALADEQALVKRQLPMRFHWCGDSVGVFYWHPYADKGDIHILCGNHGYWGAKIIQPGHGYTVADIGRKIDDKHWIAKVPSADEFLVLPNISKKELPGAEKIEAVPNFPSSRILSRNYTLDGAELPAGQVRQGKHLCVQEKVGICKFNALAEAKFRREDVNDFVAVYEFSYNFYPNGACRVNTRITYPTDVYIAAAGPMQDGDLELFNYEIYEKYIPKVKPIQEPADVKGLPQVYSFDGKKNIVDTRRYDFAGVQDMTDWRKQKDGASRFQLLVKGGYVDPMNQPDRFIEFIGKNEGGRRVRKVGNVLGLDPEFGLCRPEERAKNDKSFVLAAWHKTYPSVLSHPKRTLMKAGTVVECVGYRCYFNPECIGDATSLYVIPHEDCKKVYADFHKGVTDYELPFGEQARTAILEASEGVTLKGNKVSVSGTYGFIVVKVFDK